MSDPEAIRHTTRRCFEALTKLQAQGDRLSRYGEWAEKQKVRLEAWSVSLGVNARGRMSIAYRLRLNASMAMMILQLLEGIECCLDLLMSGDTKSEQQPSGPSPIQSSEAQPSPSVGAFDKVERILENANTGLGFLIDIATDLRKLGTRKEEQRALEFDPVDDEGNSLVEEYKRYIHTQCCLHLERTRIQNTIDSHQSANSCSFSGTGPVAQKIEYVGAENDISTEFITTRVLATVLQRWRLLCYRSHHGRSLAKNDSIVETEQGLDDNEAVTRSGESTTRPTTLRTPGHGISTARTVLTSVATEVTADRALPKPSLHKKASKSVVTRSSGVALQDVDFPTQPEGGEHETMCPICWIPTPAEDLTGRSWRSHVLRDLQPYICVFADCDSPDIRYPTTKLLRQHMDTRHVDQEWRCPRCNKSNDPKERFHDPAKFSTHLSMTHADSVADFDIDIILEHAVHRVPHTLQFCVFCRGYERDDKTAVHDHWEGLFKHMTRDHMQYLAMLSLPWDTGVPGRESDTRQSSIESSRERVDEELEVLRESEPMIFDTMPIESPDVGTVADLAKIKAVIAMKRLDPQIWMNELPNTFAEDHNYPIAEKKVAASAATAFPFAYSHEDLRFPWPSLEVLVELRCGGVVITPEVFAVAQDEFFVDRENRQWTCYRQNYFSIRCGFVLHPDIEDAHLAHLRIYYCGELHKVMAMGVRLVGVNESQKETGLVQHAPKKDGHLVNIDVIEISPTHPDKGLLSDQIRQPSPSTSPTTQHLDPSLPIQTTAKDTLYPPGHGKIGVPSTAGITPPASATEHTFERVQFKQATANNGKRRSSQQLFNLVVELLVDIRKAESDEPKWIKIAQRISGNIVVRGRSPSHYHMEGQRDLPVRSQEFGHTYSGIAAPGETIVGRVDNNYTGSTSDATSTSDTWVDDFPKA